jgi:L-asparaginase II
MKQQGRVIPEQPKLSGIFALITVSNELGQPRYGIMERILEAVKNNPLYGNQGYRV